MGISSVKGAGQAYSAMDITKTAPAVNRENAVKKASEKRIRESGEPPKPPQKQFIEAFPSKIGTKVDTFA